MCIRRSIPVWIVIVAISIPSGFISGQGSRPEVAEKQAKVADGFEIQLVASEPLVRQPVAIDFDDRGRLWVIQYLQYPNPAGLKRLQVDRFSRTRYDQIPAPPPKGPRGADRITILEDSDGDGRMDRAKDFVSGLNLASGMAFGHGGVFVLNVPYLLFYPDRNRDDVPDSDPEVFLTGFGMEDAHSVANSLTFGPDGWLYGCQGSTVTSKIRGIEFQQGVWRYHPVTKAFELFCEGGGNSWGLDFDRTGRLFYSTNHGGHVLLHGVPGGYYWKSFGKHGELHNLHAYGYFDHAPHTDFRGGHVTVGGIVYQGDTFPESYRGKYFAADLLGHAVYWHHVHSRGSTVRTAHGGELLIANDTWFAPTDITLGPDGAIYVSDWHDARTAHPDPDADWDRTNGRIFRIAAKETRRAATIDFAKFTNDELMTLLGHRSQWFVRKARMELTHRKHDPVEYERLVKKLRATATTTPDELAALESLWTLNSLGGFSESIADTLLNSPHAAVRSWTVRLLGELGTLSPAMAHRLDKFAERELAVEVRQQLACTAARLPAAQAMPIINAHINRDVDTDDPFLPLLWWWAVEKHAVSGRDEVLKRFLRPSLWKSRLGRDVLLPRLVRRYAAEPDFDSVVRLLKAASARSPLWLAVLQSMPRIAPTRELAQLLRDDWNTAPTDWTLLELAIRFGQRDAIESAIRDATDTRADETRRTRLLRILANERIESLKGAALVIASSEQPEVVRLGALVVLSRYADPTLVPNLIDIHQKSSSAKLKAQVREILFSRLESAREWVARVESGMIPASATSLEEVRRLSAFGDSQLDTVVTKHWGKIAPATKEETLAVVRRLNNDLRAATGDIARGKTLFSRHCASCHQLFGEGTKLGPDLTTANRQDRDFLLVSLVDPSGTIRKEYVSVTVQTTSGQTITGLPVERTADAITLADAKNERRSIPLREIESLKESNVSLMPENLDRQFRPQELRDLFAYLQQKK